MVVSLLGVCAALSVATSSAGIASETRDIGAVPRANSSTTAVTLASAPSATAVQRPTRPTPTLAKRAIRSGELAYAAKNYAPDVTVTVVFLSLKLGATRKATKADQVWVLTGVRPPRAGSWVTQGSGEYKVRTVGTVEYEGEPRRYCVTTRKTFWGMTSIFYKLNGKWVHRAQPPTIRNREVQKGFC